MNNFFIPRGCIPFYFEPLFKKPRCWWEKLNAVRASKNLVEIEHCYNTLDYDEHTQYHLERCLWLTSRNASVDSYNERIDNLFCSSRMKTLKKCDYERFNEKRREWAYLWLRRILEERNLKSNLVLSFYLDEQEKIGFTRENMVCDIIWDKDGGLSEFFKDENASIDFPGKRHLVRLSQWFITQRYDISLARRLVFERLRLDHPESLFLERGWIVLWIVLALFFIAMGLANHTTFWAFLDRDIDKLKNIIIVKRDSIGLILCAVAYSCFFSKILDIAIYPLKARLLTPRLIASLVIGYVPLVLAKDIWEFALNTPLLLASIMISIMISFSYLYLLFEVHKAFGGIYNSKCFKRSLSLFFRGLIFSLGIGIILMDWFALFFMKRVTIKNSPLVLWGCIGDIPVGVLCLFSCAALLLGIFLQTIWEDKSITEPL